ncbi:translocation/assembly module TamB domain-containing protein [Hydrogenophaga sp.]|uniref:translocation/assembly module TamB domain-containing protein n=1 Tax=Hydrogenophaga sp. TaxID=1904254 RepID=UPI00271826A3|nr:translocation/assembly module TamB domain-containing protein [Hydrogenophaga sp.]MDO8905093.1 translocation/assembly module TamB domain-containing protein [Hydrogenophaga sp.]
MSAPTPHNEDAETNAAVTGRKPQRSGWWVLLWVPGTLVGLLLATAVVLWVWAATPGSLAQTLTWAQNWTQDRAESVGQLDIQQVQGSLRAGGHIGDLSWSLGGLSVQARGVRVNWDNALWLNALMGRGVHVQGLSIEELRVNDQRPPAPEIAQPTEPLQELTLPLSVSVPWSVDRFTLEGGNALTLGGAKGRYRYGPGLVDGTPALPDTGGTSVTVTHQLVIDALELSGGHYRAQLTLGGSAPMPIALDLQGELEAHVPGATPKEATEDTDTSDAITLLATAKARGTLGGADALLDITAQVQSTAGTATGTRTDPALEAVARVMPWATQPLLSANATTQAFDLAVLWPQAPTTALSGSLVAEPDGATWRAKLDLTNANSGPADQQRLPLERLQVELTQTGTRWTVERLEAQLAGGQLQGTAQADVTSDANGTQVTNWQGALQVNSIQPSLLWSELASGALGGEFSARAVDGNAQAVDIQARAAPSSTPPRTTVSGNRSLSELRLEELRLQGRWTPAADTPTQGLLDLKEGRLTMAGATLDAQGRLDTVALTYAGQFNARMPGASAQWKGQLAHAQGNGAATIQISDAARLLAWLRGLQALPMVGPPLKAFLESQPGLATKGNARLEAQWQGGLGALGYPAPASTSPTAPAPSPRLQASLSVPQLQVQTAATGPATFSDLRLQAQGGLNSLQLELNGTAAQAPWRAALQSSGQLSQTNGTWQSGLLALNRLRLHVDQPGHATAASSWALQSEQPIRLQWDSDAQGLALNAGAGVLKVQPDHAVQRSGSGTGANSAAAPTLAWESLVWRAGALQTKGQVRGLPLSWVDSLSTVEGGGLPPLRAAGLGGDLVFDGQWDLLLPSDPAQPLRLSASLQRTSGDLLLLSDRAVAMGGATQASTTRANTNGRATVTIPATNGSTGNQPVAAGVREARIDIGVEGRTVQARLRWDSAQLGEASADLSTELAAPAAAGAPAAADALERWWPTSAPVRGTARARLPQVGVWSALAPPGWRVRGTLAADATLSGTRGAPEWRGNLQADDLAVRSVVDGFFFSGGQLRATLAGERVTIERFSLNGPRGADVGGTLTATGTAEWRRIEGSALRQPFIDLTVTANRLRVASRADRRLTLSGEVKAALAGPQLQLRGQLKADSALFVLPDETTPSLSSDVIVRTTRTLEVQPTLAEQVKADVLVNLDLGEQFMVRGQGLETRLAGALTVRSTPGTPDPRITGEVRTISGTYRAYGQQLNIETGALRFNGPYDNPSLDILAVRKLPEATGQRVGVQITGSAQVPRVRLFSDPELPDSEKLAWLVLGRPASAAGAQVFVLQQAARALLGGNQDLLDGELAKTFGLDEVSFQGETSAADGSTTEAAFTLGKRLSDDLYLSYEHSLSSAMSTVSMFYDLSRHLTLRARAGTENAVDLIFTVQYD